MSDFDLVNDRTDIVDLISSYTEVIRAGSKFKCRCPWHDDRRPSLTIDPVKSFWKCWVCDFYGDCIDWVMRCDGLTTVEALQKLADRAGITLSKTGKKSGESKQIYEALEVAAKFFQQNLGGKALDYLKSRGFSGETISTFGVGAAPAKMNVMSGLGIPVKTLVDSGLCARTESGNVFDRFRGRLMFPIRNPYGKIVSFGGRVIPGVDIRSKAKYINGPETAVFSKSSTLFGLDIAAREIKKTGEVFILEGYTDVMMAHQCGHLNTAACLGVAFGESHLRKLQQYCSRINMVMDGDAAGQKSMERVLPILAGSDVKIVNIPGGQDPADFLKSGGNLGHLAKDAPNPIAWKAQRCFSGFNPAEDAGRAREAIRQVVEIAAGHGRIVRDQAVGIIARMSGISESVVRGQLSGKPVQDHDNSQIVNSSLGNLEAELVRLIAGTPGIAPLVLERISPEDLSPRVSSLMKMLHNAEMSGKDVSSCSAILECTEDPDIRGLLSEAQMLLKGRRSNPEESPEEILGTVASKIERRRKRSRCL